MWQNLKNKIKAILDANALIQQVYDYEVAEFAGDPAATIVPSNNEGDYRSTLHNRRVYGFIIQVWVKRGEPRTDKQAEDVLTEVVDSVIDDFDKYFTLGTGSPGSALILGTGYTMVRVQALPSAWMYSDRETLYRGAEINVNVEIDVDVSLIS